jgi:hypothetical protein
MGKYSEEADSEISKDILAKVQLEDAIDLFLRGKRISAITLAGAADSIFTGLLEQQGKMSAAKEVWKHIVEVRKEAGLAYAGDRTEKDAFNEWNRTKNRLKHHDGKEGETLIINVFDEAYLSIQRANSDGDKLGVLAKNRQEYENWLIENIYM